MEEQLIKVIKEETWGLMDIKYIQASPIHQCIRKVYMLSKNGIDEMEQEFYPCKPYKDLEAKYQRAFRYSSHNIHHLNYHPWKFSPKCSQAIVKLNNFIVNNGINIIFYKGGTIERDMCDELDIPSYNIEYFKDLEKVHSPKPRVKVRGYYNQIMEFISL